MKLVGLILAAATAALPVAAQPGGKAVAVLPLENGGSYGRDKDEFEGLRRGLAGLLTAELARVPGVAAVDRGQTQRLVDEQGAAVAERIDAQTAVKVARAANARFVIAASFIDLYGDFRLDARIIDAQAGEVMKVVKSDPKLSDRKQAFRIVQSVAERIAETLSLGTLPPANRNLPIEAIALYGKGLVAQDKGDAKRAADFFGQAVKLAPDFVEAKDALRRGGS